MPKSAWRPRVPKARQAPSARAGSDDTCRPSRHLAQATSAELASTTCSPTPWREDPELCPVRDIGNYAFPGRNATRASRRATLDTQYQSAVPLLASGAASTLTAIDLLETVDYQNYVPEPDANYPTGRFGEGLSQVAAMLKAGIDLETAQLNLGGWDHHSNMGPLNGQFAALFAELAQGLEALYLDLDGTSVSYTLLVQTEFGRRIAPNGSAGTDHGFGSCMIAMGPNVPRRARDRGLAGHGSRVVPRALETETRSTATSRSRSTGEMWPLRFWP